jgi:hypothetical protein
MIPVRTARSNFVYRGPTPDIGDAWVERVPAERSVFMEWQPDAAERLLIAAGALIRLGIYSMEPIPPVSLGISTEPVVSADEPPKGDLRGVLGTVEVRPPGPAKPPPPPRDREVG